MCWQGPSHAMMFEHGSPIGGMPQMRNLEPLPLFRQFHEVDTTPPLIPFKLYNPVKPWYETLELASTPVPSIGESFSSRRGPTLLPDLELAHLPLERHRPIPGVEYIGPQYLGDGMYGNTRGKLRPDAPVLLGECNGDQMWAPHNWQDRIRKSGRGRYGEYL